MLAVLNEMFNVCIKAILKRPNHVNCAQKNEIICENSYPFDK